MTVSNPAASTYLPKPPMASLSSQLLAPPDPDRGQTISVSGDLAADLDHLAIFLVAATGRLSDPAMKKLLKKIFF